MSTTHAMNLAIVSSPQVFALHDAHGRLLGFCASSSMAFIGAWIQANCCRAMREQGAVVVVWQHGKPERSYTARNLP